MMTSAPIYAFMELVLPALSTIFTPSHRLLSLITMVEIMIRDERGINPVTMTIKSRKEIGGTGDKIFENKTDLNPLPHNAAF